MQIGQGYPALQLARALTTATEHEDAVTRRRAEDRVRQWQQVLDGLATGRVGVGSRTPLAGLPAWVTPEVVRGGFATGAAVAGGPPAEHELAIAERVGIPATREALFAYHLTDPGQAELSDLLDSGLYSVEVPEEAALLTVTWLARAGDRQAALTLLDALLPFAGQLRFGPRPAVTARPDSPVVWRQSTGEVAAALARKAPNPQVSAMNEALTVWNPFADELLELWLETSVDAVLAQQTPPGWPARAEALLAKYHRLAQAHQLCTKHRRPKENLAILRQALAEAVAERPLDPRRRGLLQHAVDSMVARRGHPGSASHARLRQQQRDDGARPTHYDVAQVVLSRLSGLPQDTGLADVPAVVRPVPGHHLENGREAVEVPPAVRQVVARATSGTIDVLVETGVVPSGEVLAELVPSIVATTTVAGYSDAALRTLAAAVHRAFSARRSLLLLNLAHQVRIDELPWIQAISGHRKVSGRTIEPAREALQQISTLAIAGFPGTLLPNPLLAQLGELAKAARLDVPLVEELAADIFMGRFSAKFSAAAIRAAKLLSGTPYERYYGIDYAAIRRHGQAPTKRTWWRGPAADWFTALCIERAGAKDARSSVGANGTVIEQAQILTTANLAVLVDPIGARPGDGWRPPAQQAFRDVVRLIDQLPNHEYPLRPVKDAAYAWRQMIFYLSLCSGPERLGLLEWARAHTGEQSAWARPRLTTLLDGLEGDPGQPFLGWTATGSHWLLATS